MGVFHLANRAFISDATVDQEAAHGLAHGVKMILWYFHGLLEVQQLLEVFVVDCFPFGFESDIWDGNDLNVGLAREWVVACCESSCCHLLLVGLGVFSGTIAHMYTAAY